MKREHIREAVMFMRACLYGMVGIPPAIVLAAGLWFSTIGFLVEALGDHGDKPLVGWLGTLGMFVAGNAGVVGVCRALIAPGTTTRRSIAKTAACLVGGCLALSPVIDYWIDRDARRALYHGAAQSVSALDVMMMICLGLTLLYFTEAAFALRRHARRRGRPGDDLSPGAS